MEPKGARLLSAAEVSVRLGVSKSKAHQIIKELNAVMEERGRRTIPGKVSSLIVDEEYFDIKGGDAR